jgi:hypothetical protein
MRKVDTTVKDLVSMIERGELRLPEMQRRYVWRSTRVRDLFDSLYRGYPSGSVLVWETDVEMPVHDMAVSQQKNPFMGHKLLLDGQQRLTSLSAVIRGEPVAVRGRKKPIEILFNLEHPEGPPQEVVEVSEDEDSPVLEESDLYSEEERDDEEVGSTSVLERLKSRTFVVATRALAQFPQWVSVSRVFSEATDTEILKRAGVKSLDDPRYALYTSRLARLRKIKDYPYVMQVLERELDYQEVAEIFVRVNSLGMKLRGSDLALAQITARWQNSLKLLEAFQEECEEKWFTLDLGLLVRSMVVFASRQSKFRTVGTIPIDTLKKAWEKAKDGLRFAINFLRANADIQDESLLSSPFLFIPIAVFSQLNAGKLSREEERDLLYWFYVANARGRYSRGSSETLLDADLAILFRGGAPKDLLDPMKSQFGRLHIEPPDLIGRGSNSPLFSIAFLALKANGAKDWHSGLGISLTHQGRLHYIQYHHIFPKSLLQKAGYDKGAINEIANMAFISGSTNRRISNKEPRIYLPEIIKERGEQALLKQCIPMDAELHEIDNYTKFLEARRSALTEKINAHINHAKEA